MPPSEPTRLEPDSDALVTAWVFNADGDAPTAIAIADFTASGLWFGDLAEACRGKVRIVAPDLRGRAASRSAPPPASMEDHITDLLAVANRIDAARFTVIGHGTGSHVALALAAAAPQRVGAVVVLDGPPMPGPDTDEDWITAATRIDPGIGRLRGSFAHRDAIIAAGIDSGRLPRIGMSRALRRAVDAETVGSGFGWQARLSAKNLEGDWRRFQAWSPPDYPAGSVTSLRAAHGHLVDDPPLDCWDLDVPTHIIDTTHTGLLWDRTALDTIATAVLQDAGSDPERVDLDPQTLLGP